MSYYYVSMFCLVNSISRHGLSKDITDFVFEWETTKNSGQPTQFLGFGNMLISY
jgi:hypothetical protein